MCGAKGRWKQNLVAKVLRAGAAFDDARVSPVVRQTLQHWPVEILQNTFFRSNALHLHSYGPDPHSRCECSAVS